MIQPDEETFVKLAAQGAVVPVVREVLADLDTPISLYLKLAGRGPSALLESVEGGEHLARYSFICLEPFATLRARDGRIAVERDGVAEAREGNPLAVLREVMAEYRPALPGPLPRFWGGAVGYLGYDLVRHLERLPAPPPDDLGLDDLRMMFPGVVVVFDHARRQVLVVAVARPGRRGAPGPDVRAAYRDAVARIEATVARMFQRGLGPDAVRPEPAYGGYAQGSPAAVAAGAAGAPALDAPSNMTPDAYMAAVRRAKEHIAAGDIFQVVLSQRFSAPFSGRPLDVYRVLRAMNPSPYMFHLDFGDLQLVGSSPETLVRVEDGVVTIRPIAGTRRRGRTPAEDETLEFELRRDAKERAEHVMLVDLGRNDVGRVAAYGTVRVTRLMAVERYSHVMHLVSDVQGRLARGKDAFDALAAAFPAGTLSGAPKVRAMELIDALEVARRGPYGGAVGYAGFSGNLDTCITIRTVVIHGGRAYVQAGAGIVADSDPAAEDAECRSKARALLHALAAAGDPTRPALASPAAAAAGGSAAPAADGGR